MTLVSKQLLPPAMKLGQGYVFTRVCDSVHIRRGVCPIACWDTHPPDQRQAPPPRDQRQAPPWSRQPPPQEQTPPALSWDQVHPPEQTHPPVAVHAGRYGQQGGGTHPTGMQSCFKWNIQSMANYPRIIYTAIGGNNMAKFIHYQKLANILILKLK